VNFRFHHHSPLGFFTRTAALCLSISLLLGDPSAAFAQPSPQSKTRKHSKKKSKKSKTVPCKTDCGVTTSAPEITSPTPGDATAQTELASLARGLHTAAPGSYERLASFATKNTSTVWGARAALALGYEDYTKNHLPQALNWFARAKKMPFSANMFCTGPRKPSVDKKIRPQPSPTCKPLSRNIPIAPCANNF
jgi:hypothetical protein